MLIRNSDIHTRNTRFNNMNMVCPKYTRETEGGRTFTVRTIKDWNALDVTLRKQKSIATFKRSLYTKINGPEVRFNGPEVRYAFRNCLGG